MVLQKFKHNFLKIISMTILSFINIFWGDKYAIYLLGDMYIFPDNDTYAIFKEGCLPF